MPELWRVFPWDARAAEGKPFSPSFVPGATGRGRFDLPRDLSPVLYLAESEEHAVAELLQPWRGGRLTAAQLERAGHPLALARVEIPKTARLIDLCDPAILEDLAVRPDVTASRLRERTQPIARSAWDHGGDGLRWWSSFWGDWHTVVLFTGRVGDALGFSKPTPLSLERASVRRAAGLLGMATR